MTLLNPPDILPEAMRFLLRALLAQRGFSCDRDELLALVAPDGLAATLRPLDGGQASSSEREAAGSGGQVIARESLRTLVTLGYVEESDGRLSVATQALQQWKSHHEVTATAFGRSLRPNIWRLASDEADESRYTSDFARGVALLWAIESPLEPVDFDGGERTFTSYQGEQFGPDRGSWPLTNIERWRSLLRWAPYLGLAQPVTKRLIPDGSRALLDDLADLPARRYTIGEFLQQCSSREPISDGGTLCLARPNAGHELSPGLSLSLLQLADAGHLTLRAESDTNVRVLVLGQTPEMKTRVTHVEWSPSMTTRGPRA